MSTSWNLECLDHPNARHMLDDDWSGAGTGAARDLADLWRQRGVLLQIQELLPTDGRLAAELEYGYRTLHWHTLRWIREHTNCQVELVNEYRGRLGVDQLEPLPPHHCSTCSCPPRTWS